MSNDMPMPTPTNALRNQMVQRAIKQAQDGKLPLTVRNVAMFLPGPTAYDPKLKAMESFELDADDLRPFQPPTISAETPDRLKDVEIELPDPPKPVESPQVRYQNLEAKRLELERERNDLRVSYDITIRDELTARNELDQIARGFLAAFGKPQTPDELLKRHAASEQERRRAVKAGEIPPTNRVHTPGPSVLDRYAYAQRGGRAGFAGRGYARGGQSVSKRIMPFGIAERPKLPSER